MVGHVLGSLGRSHDQRNIETAVAAVRTVGLPTFNLDVIYGAAGERLSDWRTTVRVDPRSRTAARVGVRPDDRGRHTARRAARPASRRRRPGRQVRAGGRRLHRRRTRELRGLELGPPRARVPAQPRVLAAAGLHRVRLRGPLAPGRATVVERAHARPLHRARRASSCRPRRPARRSTTRRGGSKGCSWRCGCATAYPHDALDGDRARRPGRARSGIAGCSPAPAACSPTRSP